MILQCTHCERCWGTEWCDQETWWCWHKW